MRDHRIRSSAENAIVSGGSAFNVKAESLRVGDFSAVEVRALLGQHTEQTGQPFTLHALSTARQLTCGQPGQPVAGERAVA